MLADAGCNVDFPQKRVKIPREVIEQTLRKLPGNIRLHARDEEPDLALSDDRIFTRPMSNCLCVIDSRTCVSRLALKEDLEDFVRLCDAIENINIMTHPFAISDAPAEIRDVYGAECVFRNSRKHFMFPSYSMRSLGYIIRLASMVAGGDDELKKEPTVSYFATPEAALYYGEVGEMILNAASHNIPVFVCSCPLTGATSPVTLAGTLVQSNAEFLSGALLVQLANPGNPVVYATSPVTLNMKTGSPQLAIEYGMMLVGIAKLARYYGIPSSVYGFGTDWLWKVNRSLSCLGLEA
jgi:trimethylamine--corrinoid protein Co-methyltransferase